MVRGIRKRNEQISFCCGSRRGPVAGRRARVFYSGAFSFFFSFFKIYIKMFSGAHKTGKNVRLGPFQICLQPRRGELCSLQDSFVCSLRGDFGSQHALLPACSAGTLSVCLGMETCPWARLLTAFPRAYPRDRFLRRRTCLVRLASVGQFRPERRTP